MKKRFFVFIFICLSMVVYSQTITMGQLQLKIDELEKRITLLEKIIEENKTIENKSINVLQDKMIWRKLRKGMNQDDVRSLLGEPVTINSSIITYWYYNGISSQACVTFDDKDLVIGWREP